MEIKLTIQGLLIYQTMSLYLLALLLAFTPFRRTSRWVYAFGFAVSLISIIYRGLHVGHVPMQNLFEVFLFLGMLVFPLSLFCRRFLDTGGIKLDLLLGIFVLFPAGFVFDAAPKTLPPALQSVFFIPHVFAYMAGYIVLIKASLLAAAGAFGLSTFSREERAYKLICLGFPLLTLGLILGSVWAKFAWARHWGWDPKEMWSLAAWLVYLAYFHFRYTFGVRYKKINCLWAVIGGVFIIITLLWVNLSRVFSGLHSYA